MCKVFPFRFYSFGPLAVKGDGIPGEFCPVPSALYGYQREKAEVKGGSKKQKRKKLGLAIFHNPYVSHVLET